MYLLGQGVLLRGRVRAVSTVTLDEKPVLQRLLDQQEAPPLTARRSPMESQGVTSVERWQMGLIAADQSAFSAKQWQLAKSTGTLHLLVVSGLHIAIFVLLSTVVARVITGAVALIIGRTPRWQYFHVRWLNFILVSLCLCIGVSQLELGLSVMRSLAMVGFGLFMIYSGRHLNWALAILVLMAMVSLVWPTLAFVPGYWYSFYSVLLLLFFFQYRKSHWLEGFFIPPWLLFIGLMPLSLFLASPVGWHQLLANLVAVPLIVFLILPLTIITLILPLASFEFILASLDLVFWQWLTWCDQLDWPRWVFMTPVQMLLWMTLLLVGALGANRWLLMFMFLLASCLLSLQVSRPLTGITIFDVGQGQSIWVASNHHQMIVDTGQQFSQQFSIAQNIIRPALLKAGVKQIDHLIISHDDHDHAGDIAALYRRPFQVKQLTMSQPLTVDPFQQQVTLPAWKSCQQHDEWQWVSSELGYRFLLGPTNLRTTDNNHSCIIQLDWHGQKILIPGDIDRAMERALVMKYGYQLQSDVLVLAHHGSQSSTSFLWLKAVSPKHAVISAGYGNRYGHPHPDVIARLHLFDNALFIWNTAQHGAIRIAQSGNITTVRQ